MPTDLEFAVVAEARRLTGAKFRHQGRNPLRGLDCAGIVSLAGQRAGAELVDFTDYPRRPPPELILGNLGLSFTLQEDDEIDAGRVLLFWMVGRQAVHLAVATSPTSAVLIWEGSVADEIELPDDLVSRLHSVWRYQTPA